MAVTTNIFISIIIYGLLKTMYHFSSPVDSYVW